MKQEHVTELAEDYSAGRLSLERRTQVENHLAACHECREVFESIAMALVALSGWETPPPLSAGLEEKLVASVPRPTWRRFFSAAAAVLIAVAAGSAGYLAGRRDPVAAASTAAAGDSLASFLLLLEERRWPPPSPLTRAGYGEWARALEADGRYQGAEKLTEEPGFRVESDGSVSRPEAGPRPPNVSGWYLVRARDYDDALRLARTGPHLRYGSVLVRQVE
jgi:hypothetical protein